MFIPFMDEGNFRMRKYLGLVIGFALLATTSARANSLTVRDIKLLGDGKIEIQLDGTPSRDELQMEYVRDIVQFSIQNATIYPAKILHSEDNNQSFSKVFAYQYAPSLVRVRFSVDGKADQFQGKVKWEQKGKFLTVSFPAGAVIKAVAKKDQDTDHERTLLQKVLGQSKDGPKVEKIDDAQVDAPKLSKAETAKAEAIKADAIKAEVAQAEAAENQPVFRKDRKGSEGSKQLGGARNGPSAVRSFLAMLLVVGGLGLTLLYVKKKKNTVQAKKVGDSWISNLISGGKKQKALIEVVAVHSLGPKQSITVVRIRGQQLVLGVTEGNVQLITQLDSDDDIDVMDDPKVADSIGKIFGGKPMVEPMITRKAPAPVAQNTHDSFGSLLKNSSGAGAIVARNAYQAQQSPNASVQQRAQVMATPAQSSVRDQIKQRLQGMRN
jgi:flagellar biogenesis protein FliO